jgi:hypothetical protein
MVGIFSTGGGTLWHKLVPIAGLSLSRIGRASVNESDRHVASHVELRCDPEP